MTDDNTPLCPVFGVDRWSSQAELKQSAGHTKLKSWGFCFISTVKNTHCLIYTCTQVYQSYIPDMNVCWTSAASCPLVDLIGCSGGVGGVRGGGGGHVSWIYVTQLWQNKINKSNLDGTPKFQTLHYLMKIPCHLSRQVPRSLRWLLLTGWHSFRSVYLRF